MEGQGQNEVIMAADGWIVAGGLWRDKRRETEASSPLRNAHHSPLKKFESFYFFYFFYVMQ